MRLLIALAAFAASQPAEAATCSCDPNPSPDLKVCNTKVNGETSPSICALECSHGSGVAASGEWQLCSTHHHSCHGVPDKVNCDYGLQHLCNSQYALMRKQISTDCPGLCNACPITTTLTSTTTTTVSTTSNTETSRTASTTTDTSTTTTTDSSTTTTQTTATATSVSTTTVSSTTTTQTTTPNCNGQVDEIACTEVLGEINSKILCVHPSLGAAFRSSCKILCGTCVATTSTSTLSTSTTTSRTSTTTSTATAVKCNDIADPPTLCEPGLSDLCESNLFAVRDRMMSVCPVLCDACITTSTTLTTTTATTSTSTSTSPGTCWGKADPSRCVELAATHADAWMRGLNANGAPAASGMCHQDRHELFYATYCQGKSPLAVCSQLHTSNDIKHGTDCYGDFACAKKLCASMPECGGLETETGTDAIWIVGRFDQDKVATYGHVRDLHSQYQCWVPTPASMCNYAAAECPVMCDACYEAQCGAFKDQPGCTRDLKQFCPSEAEDPYSVRELCPLLCCQAVEASKTTSTTASSTTTTETSITTSTETSTTVSTTTATGTSTTVSTTTNTETSTTVSTTTGTDTSTTLSTTTSTETSTTVSTTTTGTDTSTSITTTTGTGTSTTITTTTVSTTTVTGTTTTVSTTTGTDTTTTVSTTTGTETSTTKSSTTGTVTNPESPCGRDANACSSELEMHCGKGTYLGRYVAKHCPNMCGCEIVSSTTTSMTTSSTVANCNGVLDNVGCLELSTSDCHEKTSAMPEFSAIVRRLCIAMCDLCPSATEQPTSTSTTSSTTSSSSSTFTITSSTAASGLCNGKADPINICALPPAFCKTPDFAVRRELENTCPTLCGTCVTTTLTSTSTVSTTTFTATTTTTKTTATTVSTSTLSTSSTSTTTHTMTTKTVTTATATTTTATTATTVTTATTTTTATATTTTTTHTSTSTSTVGTCNGLRENVGCLELNKDDCDGAKTLLPAFSKIVRSMCFVLCGTCQAPSTTRKTSIITTSTATTETETTQTAACSAAVDMAACALLGPLLCFDPILSDSIMRGCPFMCGICTKSTASTSRPSTKTLTTTTATMTTTTTATSTSTSTTTPTTTSSTRTTATKNALCTGVPDDPICTNIRKLCTSVPGLYAACPRTCGHCTGPLTTTTSTATTSTVNVRPGCTADNGALLQSLSQALGHARESPAFMSSCRDVAPWCTEGSTRQAPDLNWAILLGIIRTDACPRTCNPKCA